MKRSIFASLLIIVTVAMVGRAEEGNAASSGKSGKDGGEVKLAMPGQMVQTMVARPPASSKTYYVYWYRRSSPGYVHLYLVTKNYAQALRAVNYLNEDLAVVAYYRTR
jgi:hypothetical protein